MYFKFSFICFFCIFFAVQPAADSFFASLFVRACTGLISLIFNVLCACFYSVFSGFLLPPPLAVGFFAPFFCSRFQREFILLIFSVLYPVFCRFRADNPKN
jgi:hypothetical protein